MVSPVTSVLETSLTSWPLVYRGKVRDLYAVGNDAYLMVATDRLSAFDVILPTAIPGKGQLLTQISNFWFEHFATLIDNHLLATDARELGGTAEEQAVLQGRAVVARKLRPVPVEAIVRGYVIGSGWKDYQRNGAISGVRLPQGLRMADRLAEPIFTPSTKAAKGNHDENIDFAQMCDQVGEELAEQVRATSLRIYNEAAEFARARGIIIADTKFEFGLDEQDRLILMDEVLTPDSSRFWPADAWRPGENPPSFDKQFVRDYLETLDWDKTAPGPALPPEIAEQSAAKYAEAVERLTGPPSRN